MQDWNAQTVVEILQAKEKVDCTKEQYHRDVRSGMFEFHSRQIDLGNSDLYEYCKAEVERLDKEFGIPQHHIDQSMAELTAAPPPAAF